MTPLLSLTIVGVIFLLVLFSGHPLAFTLGGWPSSSPPRSGGISALSIFSFPP
jgi:hypothetical protein